MRKTMMVWSACAAALVPALAASTAMADGVPVQGIGQQASNTQTADSTATSTQVNPTNTAINVAILSPGAASGPVSQSNSSTATSAAGNTNTTNQNAPQSSSGGGGVQTVGQAAGNAQSASSAATSTQVNPTNTAIHVAILSPGASSGPVSQSNDSTATSSAGNTNTTNQNAPQSSGGGGGGGVQATGQDAESEQHASSAATSTQSGANNTAIDVAILSPHASSGPVSQSNSSTATSAAGNTNTTNQNAPQSSGGAPEAKQAKDGCEYCSPPIIPGVQGIGQQAVNHQSASSAATSTQTNPTNTAIGLAILSPHATSGPVSQSNDSTATSAAGNTNTTNQNAVQSLGWGGAVQAIGQAAYNAQAARSAATSTQLCPANLAIGSGGASQSNGSKATSAAGNTNTTNQNAVQSLFGYPWAPVLVH
jgi:hypothetical protein